MISWVASCFRARRPSMTDDPCRGVRAHASSLEEEVALMRGVVAALRASSRRDRPPVAHREPWRWKIVALAFLGGVFVGATALIALTGCL